MLAKATNNLLRFFSRNPFRKEMLIVILGKLVALVILWKLFIAVPTVKKLEHGDLVKHFVTEMA